MVAGLGITTLKFFAFLAASCAVYWALPSRLRWPWLLVVSLAFVWESTGPVSMWLLTVVVAIAWAGPVAMGRVRAAQARLAIIVVSVGSIVILLLAVKYYNNMIVWVNRLLTRVVGRGLPAWEGVWPAPIGLSYFSLSAIGYMLDVYWETYEAERNPLRLALFVAWFPALVSGPFVRFAEQRGRLFEPKGFSYLGVKFGMERVLWGLLKKMVVADRLAIFTSAVLASPETYTGWYLVVAVVLFALQIYCDFSGCMDIVIGASDMFQVGLPENFRRPFLSQSLSEFWRRWHITLGTWAKDYVMYPMLRTRPFVSLGRWAKRRFGRKRGKLVPTYVAMLIMWTIIGFWHGGTLRFIIASGLVPWAIIVGGQLLQPIFDRMKRHVKIDCFSWRFFCSLRTLALMCVTWTVMSAGSSARSGLAAVPAMLRLDNPWVLTDGSLLGFGLDLHDFHIVFLGFLTLLVVGVLQERGLGVREVLEGQNLLFQWLVLLAGIAIVLVFGIYGPTYNAADFIYAGF